MEFLPFIVMPLSLLGLGWLLVWAINDWDSYPSASLRGDDVRRLVTWPEPYDWAGES